MNLQKNDSTTLEIFSIHFEFSGLPMVHINFVGIVVCCFDFTLTISPMVWLNVQLDLILFYCSIISLIGSASRTVILDLDLGTHLQSQVYEF